jgi:hypothetical protein
MHLVYTLSPGEGPEPKTLPADQITVTPGQPWGPVADDYALHLLARYPQIQPADSDSRKHLKKLQADQAKEKGGK